MNARNSVQRGVSTVPVQGTSRFNLAIMRKSCNTYMPTSKHQASPPPPPQKKNLCLDETLPLDLLTHHFSLTQVVLSGAVRLYPTIPCSSLKVLQYRSHLKRSLHVPEESTVGGCFTTLVYLYSTTLQW